MYVYSQIAPANHVFVCVCLLVKPNLQVFRAKFSEITPNSIRRACETLTEPDSNISDAVDVRQELDLRIGMVAILSCIIRRDTQWFIQHNRNLNLV